MGDREKDLLLPKTFPSVPKDRFYLVYMIFYFMGIGTLLPWNFFSNARQYFTFKLRNMSLNLNATNFEDREYQTELQVMFESYLTVAAMVPNIIFMFLNTVATKLISLKWRINIAALIMILLFALAIVLAKVNTSEWQMIFFTVTIISIVLMNAGSAVLQGGIFGLSGLFPKKYTQAVMGGMGMGGILAAVSNIFVLYIGSNPVESGFGYFLIAEIFIIIALVGFWILPLLRFSRYHTEEGEYKERSLTTQSEHPENDVYGSVQIDGDSGRSESDQIRGPSELDSSVAIVNSSHVPNLLKVLSKIWVYAFSVFLTFFITLSCYPAINSAIISEKFNDKEYNTWANKYFIPISCFLFFNVFDWVGRTLAGPVQWPKQGSILIPIFSMLRLAFIPLFLFCNVQPRSSFIPVLFESDWCPMIIMVFFAMSNGYLGTLLMMYGPRRVEYEDLETAGSMMSFFLSLGLGMGALLSLLLIRIV